MHWLNISTKRNILPSAITRPTSQQLWEDHKDWCPLFIQQMMDMYRITRAHDYIHIMQRQQYTRIQMEPMPLEQHISHVLNLILKISSSIHQSFSFISVESRQEEGIPAPSTLQYLDMGYCMNTAYTLTTKYPSPNTLQSAKKVACQHNYLCMPSLNHKIWCMTSTKTIKLSLMVLNS